jgi:imidazolonepropionase-like amidohydrolase
MKRVPAFALLLAFTALIASTAILAAQTPPASSQPLVFLHATVIDGTGAPAQPDMTVVIKGGRISELGKSVTVPKNAQVIDGTGKFLIPGLWDMHGHPHRPDDLALFIANGVTGLRVMAGLPWYYDARSQIQNGKLIGPRMIIGSRLMSGPGARRAPAPAATDEAGIKQEFSEVMDGGEPRSLLVANAADASHAILRAQHDGADFVKIHDGLSREAYFALANEARKQGLAFVGHVPALVSPEEASDAGQKSIEHLQGLLIACSTHEADLRKTVEDLTRFPALQRASRLAAIQREAIETFNLAKAKALAARFVRNRTWQCPTLTSLDGIREREERSNAALRYIPAKVRARWQRAAEGIPEPRSEDRALSKMLDQKLVEIVGIMHRAGVPFLAGTDAGAPYVIPGFSLHDELADLASAGFTPMQALQSATLDAARFLSQEKDWGTIQKGKVADLVLLDANPLDNIANTRRIAAVVLNGRLFDRRMLNQTLDQIRTADQK